jgi:hypothetical protein
MDRLITSLDTLRATLPDDAGVEISVSPQGDFVDVKMRGTTDRTVRLAPSDVGEGYEAAPVGNSTAEGGQFSSVLRLLLWLKEVIGEHIADLRAANMPEDLSSPEPRLDGSV